MFKGYNCTEVNDRLKATLRKSKPIIIGGAGDGFTPKLEEKGGIDIIGIYVLGKVRHYGTHGLSAMLATHSNNQVVMDYALEITNIVKETPVIAGFCAQDPLTRWPNWCAEFYAKGVSGFMNVPGAGKIDGHFGKMLKDAGLGVEKEVEVLKLIKELGYFTIGYCYTAEQAEMIAKAGVDVLACHAGGTTGGPEGFKSDFNVEETIKLMQSFIDEEKKVRPECDFLTIIHGGIIESLEITQNCLEGTEAVGFLGASAIERTPIEPILIKVV